MNPETETVAIFETTETIETTVTIVIIVTAEISRAAEIIETTLHTGTWQTVEICQEMCRQSPGRSRSNRGARSSRSLENPENLEFAW